MNAAKFTIHAGALFAAFLIYGQFSAEISGMRRALQTLAGGQAATAATMISVPAVA